MPPLTAASVSRYALELQDRMRVIALQQRSSMRAPETFAKAFGFDVRLVAPAAIRATTESLAEVWRIMSTFEAANDCPEPAGPTAGSTTKEEGNP